MVERCLVIFTLVNIYLMPPTTDPLHRIDLRTACSDQSKQKKWLNIKSIQYNTFNERPSSVFSLPHLLLMNGSLKQNIFNTKLVDAWSWRRLWNWKSASSILLIDIRPKCVLREYKKFSVQSKMSSGAILNPHLGFNLKEEELVGG